MRDDGVVECFKSPSDKQKRARFAEAQTLTSFHDQSLAKATAELNSILSKIPKNRDPNLVLSFLDTSEGLLLAWSYNVPTKVSDQDEDEVIIKELGLRTADTISSSGYYQVA